MKIIKVNRYICEFCAKRGLSAGHMRRHEGHCTKNPIRGCRVCQLLHNEQTPIEELKAILPDPEEFKREIYDDDFLPPRTAYIGLEAAVDKVLPALRDATGNCPACIMAALRQKGIPVPVAENFDFKEEMKALFAKINEEGWRKEIA